MWTCLQEAERVSEGLRGALRDASKREAALKKKLKQLQIESNLANQRQVDASDQV